MGKGVPQPAHQVRPGDFQLEAAAVDLEDPELQTRKIPSCTHPSAIDDLQADLLLREITYCNTGREWIHLDDNPSFVLRVGEIMDKAQNNNNLSTIRDEDDKNKDAKEDCDECKHNRECGKEEYISRPVEGISGRTSKERFSRGRKQGYVKRRNKQCDTTGKENINPGTRRDYEKLRKDSGDALTGHNLRTAKQNIVNQVDQVEDPCNNCNQNAPHEYEPPAEPSIVYDSDHTTAADFSSHLATCSSWRNDGDGTGAHPSTEEQETLLSITPIKMDHETTDALQEDETPHNLPEAHNTPENNQEFNCSKMFEVLAQETDLPDKDQNEVSYKGSNQLVALLDVNRRVIAKQCTFPEDSTTYSYKRKVRNEPSVRLHTSTSNFKSVNITLSLTKVNCNDCNTTPCGVCDTDLIEAASDETDSPHDGRIIRCSENTKWDHVANSECVGTSESSEEAHNSISFLQSREKRKEIYASILKNYIDNRQKSRRYKRQARLQKSKDITPQVEAMLYTEHNYLKCHKRNSSIQNKVNEDTKWKENTENQCKSHEENQSLADNEKLCRALNENQSLADNEKLYRALNENQSLADNEKLYRALNENQSKGNEDEKQAKGMANTRRTKPKSGIGCGTSSVQLDHQNYVLAAAVFGGDASCESTKTDLDNFSFKDVIISAEDLQGPSCHTDKFKEASLIYKQWASSKVVSSVDGHIDSVDTDTKGVRTNVITDQTFATEMENVHDCPCPGNSSSKQKKIKNNKGHNRSAEVEICDVNRLDVNDVTPPTRKDGISKITMRSPCDDLEQIHKHNQITNEQSELRAGLKEDRRNVPIKSPSFSSNCYMQDDKSKMAKRCRGGLKEDRRNVPIKSPSFSTNCYMQDDKSKMGKSPRGGLKEERKNFPKMSPICSPNVKPRRSNLVTHKSEELSSKNYQGKEGATILKGQGLENTTQNTTKTQQLGGLSKYGGLHDLDTGKWKESNGLFSNMKRKSQVSKAVTFAGPILKTDEDNARHSQKKSAESLPSFLEATLETIRQKAANYGDRKRQRLLGKLRSTEEQIMRLNDEMKNMTLGFPSQVENRDKRPGQHKTRNEETVVIPPTRSQQHKTRNEETVVIPPTRSQQHKTRNEETVVIPPTRSQQHKTRNEETVVIPPTRSQQHRTRNEETVVMPPTQSQQHKTRNEETVGIPPTRSQQHRTRNEETVVIPPTRSQHNKTRNEETVVIPPIQSNQHKTRNEETVVMPPTQSQAEKLQGQLVSKHEKTTNELSDRSTTPDKNKKRASIQHRSNTKREVNGHKTDKLNTNTPTFLFKDSYKAASRRILSKYNILDKSNLLKDSAAIFSTLSNQSHHIPPVVHNYGDVTTRAGLVSQMTSSRNVRSPSHNGINKPTSLSGERASTTVPKVSQMVAHREYRATKHNLASLPDKYMVIDKGPVARANVETAFRVAPPSSSFPWQSARKQLDRPFKLSDYLTGKSSAALNLTSNSFSSNDANVEISSEEEASTFTRATTTFPAHQASESPPAVADRPSSISGNFISYLSARLFKSCSPSRNGAHQEVPRHRTSMSSPVDYADYINMYGQDGEVSSPVDAPLLVSISRTEEQDNLSSHQEDLPYLLFKGSESSVFINLLDKKHQSSQDISAMKEKTRTKGLYGGLPRLPVLNPHGKSGAVKLSRDMSVPDRAAGINNKGLMRENESKHGKKYAEGGAQKWSLGSDRYQPLEMDDFSLMTDEEKKIADNFRLYMSSLCRNLSPPPPPSAIQNKLIPSISIELVKEPFVNSATHTRSEDDLSYDNLGDEYKHLQRRRKGAVLEPSINFEQKKGPLEKSATHTRSADDLSYNSGDEYEHLRKRSKGAVLEPSKRLGLLHEFEFYNNLNNLEHSGRTYREGRLDTLGYTSDKDRKEQGSRMDGKKKTFSEAYSPDRTARCPDDGVRLLARPTIEVVDIAKAKLTCTLREQQTETEYKDRGYCYLHENYLKEPLKKLGPIQKENENGNQPIRLLADSHYYPNSKVLNIVVKPVNLVLRKAGLNVMVKMYHNPHISPVRHEKSPENKKATQRKKLSVMPSSTKFSRNIIDLRATNPPFNTTIDKEADERHRRMFGHWAIL